MLWLWHRLAATVLIRPLAWEPPYAAGVTLKKSPKKKKKKRRRRRKKERKKGGKEGRQEGRKKVIQSKFTPQGTRTRRTN